MLTREEVEKVLDQWRSEEIEIEIDDDTSFEEDALYLRVSYEEETERSTISCPFFMEFVELDNHIYVGADFSYTIKDTVPSSIRQFLISFSKQLQQLIQEKPNQRLKFVTGTVLSYSWGIDTVT